MSSEEAASCAYAQEGFVQLRKILPDDAQDIGCSHPCIGDPFLWLGAELHCFIGKRVGKSYLFIQALKS